MKIADIDIIIKWITFNTPVLSCFLFDVSEWGMVIWKHQLVGRSRIRHWATEGRNVDKCRRITALHNYEQIMDDITKLITSDSSVYMNTFYINVRLQESVQRWQRCATLHFSPLDRPCSFLVIHDPCGVIDRMLTLALMRLYSANQNHLMWCSSYPKAVAIPAVKHSSLFSISVLNLHPLILRNIMALLIKACGQNMRFAHSKLFFGLTSVPNRSAVENDDAVLRPTCVHR